MHPRNVALLMVALAVASTGCAHRGRAARPELQRARDGALLVVPSRDARGVERIHACLAETGAPGLEPAAPGMRESARAGEARAISQLAQASLYRLCEARANGDISREQFVSLYRQTLETATRMLTAQAELARKTERGRTAGAVARDKAQLESAQARVRRARRALEQATSALESIRAEVRTARPSPEQEQRLADAERRRAAAERKLEKAQRQADRAQAELSAARARQRALEPARTRKPARPEKPRPPQSAAPGEPEPKPAPAPETAP